MGKSHADYSLEPGKHKSRPSSPGFSIRRTAPLPCRWLCSVEIKDGPDASKTVQTLTVLLKSRVSGDWGGDGGVTHGCHNMSLDSHERDPALLLQEDL